MLKSVLGDAANFIVTQLEPMGQPAHQFLARDVFAMLPSKLVAANALRNHPRNLKVHSPSPSGIPNYVIIN